MIYKFPKPDIFYKGLLSSYKGDYIEMFVPNSDEEKFCYVNLLESQLQDFFKHFGSDGFDIVEDEKEYPGNDYVRIHKFMVVRPR